MCLSRTCNYTGHHLRIRPVIILTLDDQAEGQMGFLDKTINVFCEIKKNMRSDHIFVQGGRRAE